ncbi:MAG: hypothetical protein VX913_06000, partial [Planctomycetota bacterium]|nr:hypothetical protein [Planctomycetota bacterium]
MVAHFTRVRAWTLCLGLAVVIIGGVSCSGGGSASPGAGGPPTPPGPPTGAGVGALVETSFSAQLDPSGVITLSMVYVDEVLTFRFDGPLAAGIFGGFAEDSSGSPIEFIGTGPTP